jgi:hypothetical protein
VTRFSAILSAILLFFAVQANAQRAQTRGHSSDRSLQLTSNIGSQTRCEIGRKAGQIAVVSLPVMALGGVAALDADGGLKNLRDRWMPDFRNRTDDYLQYSPGALMLALKAAGVQGRSTWGEMLTASAAAYAIMGFLVNALKYTTSVERPDGVDTHSFPSGHSATAFMMAELLTREYGELSPWVGVGAYSLASLTGAMRIANNKHWLSDVLTGAGLGILSAEAGYLISDILFKKDFSCEELSDDETPSFFGLYTGTGWLWSSAESRVSHFGLEGAHFLNPWLGLGGRAVVSYAGTSGAWYPPDSYYSSDFNIASSSDRDHSSESLNNFVSFTAGAYFSLPLSKRISLGSKALAGYYRECAAPAGAYSIIDSIDLGSGLDLGTGLSANLRLRDHYGIRLFADYDLLSSHSLLTLGFSVNALW